MQTSTKTTLPQALIILDLSLHSNMMILSVSYFFQLPYRCSLSSSPSAVSSWSPASSCTSIGGASCLVSSSLSSPSCQSPRCRPHILHQTVDDRSMSDPCQIGPRCRRRYWRRDCASAQVYMALLLRPLGAMDQHMRLDKVHPLSSVLRFLVAVCIPVLQGPSGRV